MSDESRVDECLRTYLSPMTTMDHLLGVCIPLVWRFNLNELFNCWSLKQRRGAGNSFYVIESDYQSRWRNEILGNIRNIYLTVWISTAVWCYQLYYPGDYTFLSQWLSRTIIEGITDWSTNDGSQGGGSGVGGCSAREGRGDPIVDKSALPLIHFCQWRLDI